MKQEEQVLDQMSTDTQAQTKEQLEQEQSSTSSEEKTWTERLGLEEAEEGKGEKKSLVREVFEALIELGNSI